MINKKKTLYEILGVLPSASYSEIQAAYQKLSQKIQSKESGLSLEEIDFRMKVINLAVDTLSVNSSRATYDAKLGLGNAPANNFVPVKVEVAIEGNHKSPLRIILTIIAGLMAVGMVIQVAFMSLAYRNAAHQLDGVERVSGAASKAEEKVILQEYYQEHGVRAGSKIEAELLDAEDRRRANEQREKNYAKQEQDRKYKQFIEDSKRVGDQVSEDLRRAEREQHIAAEQKQRQLEAEKRQKDELERRRIEYEKQQWRSSLSRHYYN